MIEDILYKPEEVAKTLKITKYTVYEMIKRGDLEAHRIGKSLRISQTQLESYLMKSKGLENVFDVDIYHDGDDTFARVGELEICVSSPMTGSAKISIRPEDIILSKGTFVSSARNILHGTVTGINEEERSIRVHLNVGVPMTALITRRSLLEMDIKNGDQLYAIFKTMSVIVLR